MELNKYDLVEFMAFQLKNVPCLDCPIKNECNSSYICLDEDEDETRDLLIKKYNL